MLHQFTFITIAYEESDELVKTFNSIKQLLSSGSNWVLVINQGLKDFSPPENTKIIEGKDNSLYDALNLGLSEVSTDYFMLIHAGDEIFDLKAFCRAASCLNDHYDYILGGAYIGNRLHMSKNWKRWMFRFYVQPPHLPIIYKTQSCIQDRYNVHISTVADFYYLRKLFNRRHVTFKHSNEVYIRMAPGGLTTSGLSSFIHVTKSFMQIDGITPLLLSPLRFLFKILLR